MAISLLPLNDGETLGSNFARYAEVIGLPSTRILRHRLFGYLCTTETQLPTNMSYLAAQTRDYWNLKAEQIVKGNTEFPYVTMLMSPTARSKLLATMLSPSRVGVRRSIGERAPRLRYCDECLAEWRSAGVTPFWKINHQLPGVYYCDVHLTVLKVAGRPASASSDFTLESLRLKSDSAVAQNATASEAKAIKDMAIRSVRQQVGRTTSERARYRQLLQDAAFARLVSADDLLLYFGQEYCCLTGVHQQKVIERWHSSTRSYEKTFVHPFMFLATLSFLEHRASNPGSFVPSIPVWRRSFSSQVKLERVASLPVAPKQSLPSKRASDEWIS
jgi:hypothetical protein